MDSKIYVFGIKVFLKSSPSVSDKTSIGLFDDAENGANDVFRWSSADLTIFSPTYNFKTGILSKNGIGSISESVPDPFNGGDVSDESSTEFSILNTLTIGGTPTPFDRFLYNSDIIMLNLVCEILYFEISSGTLLNPGGTVLFRGVLNEPTTNETTLTFRVEDPYKSRSVETSISEGTNNTEISPLLGTFKIELEDDVISWGGAAKVQRTEDSSIRWKTGYNVKVADDIYMSVLGNRDQGLDVFPVQLVGEATPVPTLYNIKTSSLGILWTDINGIPITSGGWVLTELAGLVLTVVDGTGKGQSTIIGSAVINLTGLPANDAITIFPDPYFKVSLVGDSTFTNPDNSWVTFSKSSNLYVADTWPCKSFLSPVDEEIVSNLAVYNYVSDEETFDSIPSLDVSPLDTDNNSFAFPSSVYNQQSNESLNYQFIAPKSITLFDVDSSPPISPVINNDLAIYTGNSKWNTNTKSISPGFYLRNTNASDQDTTLGSIVGPIQDIIDADSSTGLTYRYTHPTDAIILDHDLINGFELELPKLPVGQSFNNMFLAVNVSAQKSAPATSSDIKLNVYVVLRRFVGLNTFEKVVPLSLKDNGQVDAAVYNFPDNFFSDVITDTYDLHFIYENENYISAKGHTASGIELFSLDPLGNAEEFNAHKFIYLFVEVENIVDGLYVDVAINNVAFCYINSIKPGKDVYTALKGRVFDDTWGARKTASDQILTPQEFIEHLKRIGNWGEVGDTNVFGKEYAPNALIDTSSFDSAELSFLSTFRPSIQKKGSIDDIVRVIAHDYWIYSHIDSENGNEILTPVARRALTAPTLTIDYTDIVGEIGLTRGTDVNRIFPELTIRYAYNYAKSGFDKTIAITNSNQAAYDIAYTEGLTGIKSELLWNFSKKLYEVSKSVSTPNQRMIDLYSVVNQDEAIFYLEKCFEMMGVITTDGGITGIVFDPKRSINFSIPLALGIDLHKAGHFNLSFPHQTESITIECEIISIDKDPSSRLVHITTMLLGYDESIDVDVFEVISGGLAPDWDESVDSFSIHGEGQDIDENS